MQAYYLNWDFYDCYNCDTLIAKKPLSRTASIHIRSKKSYKSWSEMTITRFTFTQHYGPNHGYQKQDRSQFKGQDIIAVQ